MQATADLLSIEVQTGEAGLMECQLGKGMFHVGGGGTVSVGSPRKTW